MCTITDFTRSLCQENRSLASWIGMIFSCKYMNKYNMETNDRQVIPLFTVDFNLMTYFYAPLKNLHQFCSISRELIPVLDFNDLGSFDVSRSRVKLTIGRCSLFNILRTLCLTDKLKTLLPLRKYKVDDS